MQHSTPHDIQGEIICVTDIIIKGATNAIFQHRGTSEAACKGWGRGGARKDTALGGRNGQLSVSPAL